MGDHTLNHSPTVSTITAFVTSSHPIIQVHYLPCTANRSLSPPFKDGLSSFLHCFPPSHITYNQPPNLLHLLVSRMPRSRASKRHIDEPSQSKKLRSLRSPTTKAARLSLDHSSRLTPPSRSDPPCIDISNKKTERKAGERQTRSLDDSTQSKPFTPSTEDSSRVSVDHHRTPRPFPSTVHVPPHPRSKPTHCLRHSLV